MKFRNGCAKVARFHLLSDKGCRSLVNAPHIQKPALLDDAPYLARAEKQFIVDRRKLRNVRVLEHFAQEDWAPPWRLR
jgi:hypothetical protein